MTDFELNEILEEADRSGAGAISEPDFMRIMKKTDLTPQYKEATED
jgi:Ca2+-binding EF-hand superfamily protein